MNNDEYMSIPINKSNKDDSINFKADNYILKELIYLPKYKKL
jgi:hypothetical protein